VTGKWKAEGNILYSQPPGTDQWIPLGRYALSGARDLMIYSAGGGKQHWYRK
jgi:hypothetical protein